LGTWKGPEEGVEEKGRRRLKEEKLEEGGWL
jgi:hypothetical protein